MVKESEPLKLKWREPTPDSSDDEGSSSTEYEFGVAITPRATKKRRTKAEDDPDFDPKGKTQWSSREEEDDRVLASLHASIKSTLNDLCS
jgi:hypothetical protein